MKKIFHVSKSFGMTISDYITGERGPWHTVSQKISITLGSTLTWWINTKPRVHCTLNETQTKHEQCPSHKIQNFPFSSLIMIAAALSVGIVLVFFLFYFLRSCDFEQSPSLLHLPPKSSDLASNPLRRILVTSGHSQAQKGVRKTDWP